MQQNSQLTQCYWRCSLFQVQPGTTMIICSRKPFKLTTLKATLMLSVQHTHFQALSYALMLTQKCQKEPKKKKSFIKRYCWLGSYIAYQAPPECCQPETQVLDKQCMKMHLNFFHLKNLPKTVL